MTVEYTLWKSMNYSPLDWHSDSQLNSHSNPQSACIPHPIDIICISLSVVYKKK